MHTKQVLVLFFFVLFPSLLFRIVRSFFYTDRLNSNDPNYPNFFKKQHIVLFIIFDIFDKFASMFVYVCVRISIDFSYMDLDIDSVEMTLTNMQFVKDFLVFQFLVLKCFCTALGTACLETCDHFLLNSLISATHYLKKKYHR